MKITIESEGYSKDFDLNQADERNFIDAIFDHNSSYLKCKPISALNDMEDFIQEPSGIKKSLNSVKNPALESNIIPHRRYNSIAFYKDDIKTRIMRVANVDNEVKEPALDILITDEKHRVYGDIWIESEHDLKYIAEAFEFYMDLISDSKK